MDFWFSLELNGIHSRKVKERRGNFFLFLSSVVGVWWGPVWMLWDSAKFSEWLGYDFVRVGGG